MSISIVSAELQKDIEINEITKKRYLNIFNPLIFLILKINKDAEYKFEIPGIYLYICTPHKAMGMIGLVVVGDDLSNLDKIKKAKMRGKSKKIFKELLKEL